MAEVDDMDVDGTHAPVDQDRRRRAAQKLTERLGAEQGEDEDVTLTEAQAKAILKNSGDMLLGRRINANNAFDHKTIEALKTLVTAEEAGEGFFQRIGMGLDTAIRIYGFRIDNVYYQTFQVFGAKKPVKDGDDEDREDQDEEGKAEGDAEGGEGDTDGKPKSKKQQTSTDPASTLSSDSALKSRVKEVTFDTDPFFINTSRMIDESSPQGMLLHNLPVLSDYNIVFDASARPQDLLADVRADAKAAKPDMVVHLSALPGALKLLESATRGSVHPGIEQLYRLLQPQAELPGLAAAAQVDPEALLRQALAENNRARAQAHRNAAVRQVVQRVEDAMDVDMADAADGGGAADDNGGEGADDGDAAFGDDDAGPAHSYGSGGGGGGYNDGYDSPGYGGAGRGDDVAAPRGRDEAGGRQRGGRDMDDYESELGNLRDNDGGGTGSDDDSALLSLLSGRGGSALDGATASSQRTWWKSRVKRVGAAGTSKPRTRKEKPAAITLDFAEYRACEAVLELVDLRETCYKVTRKNATAKTLLKPEEPERPERLRVDFSSTLNPDASAVGSGPTVHDGWTAVVLSDRQSERERERQQRYREQQAAAGAGATPARQQGGPAASGTQGTEGGAGGFGEEYGSGGSPGGYDDGMPDHGGAYSDDGDDDTQDAGGLGGGNGQAPTLEELLQPPRRVQRMAVKFDKTAGVADVASLKRNMEQSIRHMAVSALHRRQSAPEPPALTFQAVLDQVSSQAAASSAAAAARPGGLTPGKQAGGDGGLSSLAGVSTHLAFICLLHLANEKSLALGNNGDMDTLHITGLGDLSNANVAATAAAMAAMQH